LATLTFDNAVLSSADNFCMWHRDDIFYWEVTYS